MTFTSLSLSSLALALFLALSLAACGSSSDGETPDAAPDGSGGAVRAEVITCPASVTKEVVTTNGENRYTPMSTTVTAGTVVRFKMSISHDTRSRDRLFTIALGETACVRFNLPGTYQFDCGSHSFNGNIIVQ